MTPNASTPTASRDLTFILGGARSGKSACAERLADASGLPVTYIATARIGDAEFAERVQHHRARRPAHWTLVEAPLDLAGALREADRAGHCVLIDCLTLWLANLLCPCDPDSASDPASHPAFDSASDSACDSASDFAPDPASGSASASAETATLPRAAIEAFDAFDRALADARGKVIVVSNEIGLGVVPLGSVTRLYVDELGRLNQRVAAASTRATLMVAGLPLVLKG